MAQSLATLRTMHVNAPLSVLSVKYENAAFVGTKIFPLVPVKHESDLYFIYGNDAFRPEDDYRANGAPSKEVHYTLDTGTYTCESHSLHDIVTQRDRRNADNPLSPDADTAQNVTDKVLLMHEAMAAAACSAIANYPSSSHYYDMQGKWAMANQADADVRLRIFAGKSQVFSSVHKYPNTIVIPAPVGDALSLMAEIDELRKYTDPRLLTDGGLPSPLWGMKVLEAGASYLNSAEGVATETTKGVWGDNVWMGYVNPQPTGLKTMTWGQTIESQPRRVQKWWDQDRGGDIIEVEWIYVPKIICAGAGYLLIDCLSDTSGDY